MSVNAFRISKHKNLSDELLSVLTLCYLPIIGHLPYSIYLTLYSLPSIKHEINRVCNLLNIDETTLLSGIKQLELVGLVVKYESIDEYYFKLNNHLTKEEFFSSIILTKMLKSKVDKELFDFLCNEDVINIPDNYILSSTKFDEHYESKDNNIVLTKNINFEKFIDSMKNNRNKDFTKFSKRIISVLDQIHFLYQFDEPTLASIYEKSKGDSESETITKMNYNASVLSRKNKIDRVIVEKYDDNDSLIDNMNPNLIIEKYSNKYNDDLDIVNRILTNYNLPYGVINYLIMSLYKNKGDIPNYNYFEKVVKTIIKAGIVDANGAKLYFESAKKNYNNKGKVSASWVDDFIKNELGDFK